MTADQHDAPGTSPRPLRAVVTGMVLGALLSVCNLYSGLKVGWSTNMSITSALLAYGLWHARPRAARERSPFTLFDTNLAQTAASAAASVSSAGLVAGIPALALTSGIVLPWPKLAAWVFGVCLLGIALAVPVRRQMIIRDELRFPLGIATAETLQQMYARGAEALGKVRALLASGAVAAALKIAVRKKLVSTIAVPGAIGGYPLKNLTWSLEPSFFLVSIGGLMGFRACVSALLGGVLAFGVGAPSLLARGVVKPGAPDARWFTQLVGWLLWPGVTLLVVSALTTLALGVPSIIRSMRARKLGDAPDDEPAARAIPTRWMAVVALAAVLLVLALQIALFDIPWWAAAIGVALSLLLALVATRTQGETGLTPVGAMGKVTQLSVGALLPGDAAANLMTANVTGGAASLCADLMNDFKIGKILGAPPRRLWLAHLAGALAGATFGSAMYLVLLPNPKAQLFTDEFPAPAVATWKAVAEVFQRGAGGLPPGAATAAITAGLVAIALSVLEAKLPASARRFVPAPAALGLGFLVPADQVLAIFVGGVAALAFERAKPALAKRIWVPLCAGAIAGESLAAVAGSVFDLVSRR